MKPTIKILRSDDIVVCYNGYYHRVSSVQVALDLYRSFQEREHHVRKRELQKQESVQRGHCSGKASDYLRAWTRNTETRRNGNG